MHAGKGNEANDRSKRDQGGFGQFLHLPDQSDRDERDKRSEQVHDRSLGKDDDGASDGPDSGCGDTRYKCQQVRTLAVFLEVRSRQDREQIARQKGTQRRYYRSCEAGDQVTNEADGDDNRTRGDQSDCHGVYKLALVQPLMVMHHATVEEGNDGETATKDKCPCLGKEGTELKRRGVCLLSPDNTYAILTQWPARLKKIGLRLQLVSP